MMVLGTSHVPVGKKLAVPAEVTQKNKKTDVCLHRVATCQFSAYQQVTIIHTKRVRNYEGTFTLRIIKNVIQLIHYFGHSQRKEV